MTDATVTPSEHNEIMEEARKKARAFIDGLIIIRREETVK